MSTCQHIRYYGAERGPAKTAPCNCLDCGQTWVTHTSELRFAPGVVGGFTADALLTPRDERTPGMRQVLGLE